MALSILTVLLSLPLFTSQFSGAGEIMTRGCMETTNGYFAVCTERSYPGGTPSTFRVWLNEYGTPTLSMYLGSGLEALQMCTFGGMATILLRRPLHNYTTVCQTGDTDSRPAVFQDQFMHTAAMYPQADNLVLAGNDFPGDTSVRIAVLDPDMMVVSNQQYQGLYILVADVARVNGEICVLGSTEQPGWQRDVTLFFPGTMTEHHLQPLPGRFEPVGIEPHGDGCIVTANAMTDQNGMIGEIFLMKLDQNMSIQWTATLGGESWLNATAMDLTGEGVVLTGWTNDIGSYGSNRSDLLMAEFSEEGQLLWTREYGGNTVDYGLDVETCQDGGFLVSGCFVNNLYDGLLLRTDSLGLQDTMGFQEEGSSGPLISVLSNPSRGNTIGVSLPGWANGQVELSVVDITGRTVRTATTETETAAFHGLPAGMYLVVARSGETSATASVMVIGGER